MKIAEGLIGSTMGLYDRTKNESIVAYKAIDVSDICPNETRVVIKYAKVTLGTIAQICSFYKKDVDLGITLHYDISLFKKEEWLTFPTFINMCKVMGANASELVEVIYANSDENIESAVDLLKCDNILSSLETVDRYCQKLLDANTSLDQFCSGVFAVKNRVKHMAVKHKQSRGIKDPEPTQDEVSRIKQLMETRFKVLIAYPNSIYSVGTIIPGNVLSSHFRKFHGCFRELLWWEERSLDILPSFLRKTNKYQNDDVDISVFKVEKWINAPNPRGEVLFTYMNYINDDISVSNVGPELIPATEEEYKTYISKNHPNRI